MTEDPPRSLNSTAVMKECMNNSYYPKQFLPDFDDVNIASMELNILIFIIAGCVTCLIIITVSSLEDIRKVLCAMCTSLQHMSTLYKILNCIEV